jgi:hypothetical protein
MDQNDKEAEVRAAEYPKMLMYPGIVSSLIGLCGFLFIPWAIEDDVGIQRVVNFLVMTFGCLVAAQSGWLLITKKAKTIFPGGLLILPGIIGLFAAYIEFEDGPYAPFLCVGVFCFTAGLVSFKCRTQLKEWCDSQVKEGE